MTVGVDLIEIERIRRALERHPSFRERCFTEAERPTATLGRTRHSTTPRDSLARRRRKAIGFGVARAFAWRDVEIAGRPKPSVRLSGRMEAWAAKVGAGALDLSMTHGRESLPPCASPMLDLSTRPRRCARPRRGMTSRR